MDEYTFSNGQGEVLCSQCGAWVAFRCDYEPADPRAGILRASWDCLITEPCKCGDARAVALESELNERLINELE